MKLPRTFIVTFLAAFVLLLITAWKPSAIAWAWTFSFGLMYVGGFIALMISVTAELGNSRKAFAAKSLRRSIFQISSGQLLTQAVLGTMLVFTFVYDIFPFVWNVVAAAVIGLCVAGRFVRDYAELFHARPMPDPPREWTALENGHLPAMSPEQLAHANERFHHSHELKVTCRPRAGALGMATYPLRMDE